MSDWTGTLLQVVLDASLRIAIVAGGAALILAIARARASSVRHFTWTFVLCAMMLMPVLPHWIPAISIPRVAPVVSPAPAVVLSSPLTPQSEQNVELPVPNEPSIPSLPSVLAIPGWRSWEFPVTAIYLAISLLFMLRLSLGWIATQRVFRRSRRAVLGGNAPIYSSERIGTPITIGFVKPRIILPASWRQWSREKRRAVLSHEIAHIRRHDPLVRFLANLNHCIFWFHPLAWWLEKRLAATAEHACDDAAVRRIGDKRRYAEVLLDIAEAVNRRGGRISWEGVGVDGNGLLGERIDRILRRPDPEPSKSRKRLIVACCVSILLLVVACRSSRPPVEEEMQALARSEAERQNHASLVLAERTYFEAMEKPQKDAQNLTPDQAAMLESRVRANARDFNARRTLLAYYTKLTGSKAGTPSEIVPARRQHILWFIEFDPEDNLHHTPLTFINVDPADPYADPEGYNEGKKLWLKHAARPDTTILSNAAYFFQVGDKALAEDMLLRLQTAQPLGPWRERLARVYAATLLGATAIWPTPSDLNANLVVLSTNPAKSRTPAADEVRRKLEASTDDELLTLVARVLNARGVKYPETKELAKHYLQRAAELNPRSEAAIEMHRMLHADRAERIRPLPTEHRYEAASAMPDRDRFELFWNLAEFSYSYGNSFDSTHFDDAKREWEKSRRYAADLVAVAAKFRNDPEYGTAVFNGNVMMGFVAAQNHENALALQFLREAMKAPNTAKGGVLAVMPYSAPWSRLCTALIDDGHINDVIEFLDHFAELDVIEHDDILASAARLRKGVMPDWYRRRPTV